MSDVDASYLRRRIRSHRLVVHDRSMQPTFEPGDRLLVDPRAYARVAPAVGDLVVLRDPVDADRWLLKRVAAVAGEPIPARLPPGDSPTVPDGHLFVLSDRREAGRDSRRFGPIPLPAVVGKVWFRYAPRTRRGPV